MNEIRAQLLAALAILADAGTAADAMLLAAETSAAGAPTVDEQPVMTLSGISREVWEAHKAAQRAIRATYHYEKLGSGAA
jgi:hypothetical protein